MGRKKVPLEQLEAEVANILKEYEGDVFEQMSQAAVQYGKIGQRKLKENSPVKAAKGGGRYAKGWAWKRTGMNRKDGSVGVTLYNRALPGLPHLLEHGHANRGGGRTPGKVHIAPIEQEICEEFEKEVVDKVQTSI